MQNSNHQKSSGFLTIVAFVMVLFGVGYLLSCILGSTTLAKDTGNYNLSISETGSQDLQGKEDQDKDFANIEDSVAQRAVSGWNKLMSNNDSTKSLTVQLPQEEVYTDSGENKNTGYKDFSTTNTNDTSIDLSFANGYVSPSVYQDISNSPYQDSITILYSNGILQSSNNFYPYNYVRVSDFIRVVMDAYRVQLGYEPSSLVGLTTNFYISDSSFDSGVLMRVNSAYELGFLQSLELKNSEGDLRLNAFITPKEAKEILATMKLKNSSLIKTIPNISFVSKETLRKDEMAELVVSAFGLKLNEGSLAVFSDISGSVYQEEIQLLHKLGIIGGTDGKFYPDAKIENKDFVIMVVRALMRQSNSQFTINNFYYLKNLLHDTYSSYNNTYDATYSPYLEFCLESQICDSLLTQTSYGVSFEPNRLLSQGEITSVLSNSSKNQFILAGNGEELITRGEVAKLIVDAFGFKDAESGSGNFAINNVSETTDSSGNALSSLWEQFQELMKIS